MYVDGVLLGKFCTAPPTNKLVSSISIDVYFHSDAYANDVGFVATYSVSDSMLTTFNLTIGLNVSIQNFHCITSSRKHAYISLIPLNTTLYCKTWVYRGIHYFFLFLFKNINSGNSLEPSNEY